MKGEDLAAHAAFMRRLTFLCLFLSATALSVNGGSLAQTPGPQSDDAAELSYGVELQGLDGYPGALDDKLRAVSLSLLLVDDPPLTEAGLRRRAEQDLERFRRVLHSEGHYDGAVSFAIERREERRSIWLVFTVEPGPAYLLERVVLVTGPDASEADANDTLMAEIGLEIGQTATAESIISGERRLVRHFRRYGRPFAAVPARRTTIDRSWKTLTVRYVLEVGPRARFGAPRIDGLESIDPRYIHASIAWRADEPYDIREVEETQRTLAASGLFESVDIAAVPPDEPTGPGEEIRVPMQIVLRERAHRSIGFGASYSTSVGPGVFGLWEHRNLFSGGERFRTRLDVSPVERTLSSTFRRPYFLRTDQAFVAETEITDTKTDAFDERRATFFGGVERELSRWWTVTAGPTLDLISQNVPDSRQTGILLAGLRGTLRYDNTDDLLNPSSGARLQLDGAPYYDIGDRDSRFLSTSVTASSYLSIDDNSNFILAGRTRLGSIVGEERSEIPAGKRFYAGGGGSVRAFGFQRLGPLDVELDPIGGRSVIELGLELRIRITETIGIVPFIEAGNVYEDAIPPFGEPDLLWGVGLGFRYFTDIGPVRLDIAIPVDKRRDIDAAYQFYVSLGQAF